MKKPFVALVSASALILLTWFSNRSPGGYSGTKKKEEVAASTQRDGKDVVRLTVITTNDLHSAADTTDVDGEPPRSRLLQTSIEGLRTSRQAKGSRVLTLDAGDWTHSTVPDPAFFEAAGYDAVALGNHEFDAGVAGLQRMLEGKTSAAVRILSSNMMPPLPGVRSFLVKSLGTTSDNEEINAGGRRDGFRVGIFSLLGPDAAFCCRRKRRKSPVSFTGYNDSTNLLQYDLLHEAANKMVKFLREDQACDIVILLMHGGTGLSGSGETQLEEDMDLAKAVPGIDIIVAGHTHENYFKSFSHSESYHPLTTYMWQCNSEGKSLGVADFTFRPDGKGGLIPDQRTAEGSKAVCLEVTR